MIKAAYIHIPFCRHICHYCDFNKVFIQNQPVATYLDALKREMELTLQQHPTTYLKSIFVGGGTPTALNAKQLHQLTENIKNVLPYDEHTEYTFEVNPGDLCEEKYMILKDAGVNRLSFGVQTFNNELLKRIGRTHKNSDVFQSIELARNIGFTNISIDLMYGLPGQTVADFSDTLQTALTLPITHLSGYSLIVEEKTVFYQLWSRGQLHLPSNDQEADMYEFLIQTMEAHGLGQYEISNFAKDQAESIHNLTYWNNEPYYGFGAGAHGYVDNRRQSNVIPLKKYISLLTANQLPLRDIHLVTKPEQMEEEMFLGLRKTEGVSLKLFSKKYAKDPLDLFAQAIDTHLKQDLLEIKANHLRLTKKGRFLGNEVFQSFIGII